MTEPTSRKRSRDRAASGDQEAARSKQLIEDLNRCAHQASKHFKIQSWCCLALLSAKPKP
jgi:hypothetical protein